MIAGVRRIVEIIICHFRIPSIIADAEDFELVLDVEALIEKQGIKKVVNKQT